MFRPPPHVYERHYRKFQIMRTCRARPPKTLPFVSRKCAKSHNWLLQVPQPPQAFGERCFVGDAQFALGRGHGVDGDDGAGGGGAVSEEFAQYTALKLGVRR